MEEVKKIKEKLEQSHTMLEAGYAKIIEAIIEEYQELVVEANKYQRKIAELKSDWKKIKSEVEDLQKRRKALKAKEESVEKRLGGVIAREGQVTDMMKIQTNRQKILDEKEKELQVRDRRKPIYPEN